MIVILPSKKNTKRQIAEIVISLPNALVAVQNSRRCQDGIQACPRNLALKEECGLTRLMTSSLWMVIAWVTFPKTIRMEIQESNMG